MFLNPYIPSKLKSLEKRNKNVSGSFSDFNLSDSNIGGNGSYRYDPIGSPLKSTQQLNVDWSAFENHTFFSSAEVKVNESFNKIINGYPFDGTRKEVEVFLDSLTGFEKWIWDLFPRNNGALKLYNNAYITVKDKSGNLYPDLSKNSKGETVINPQDSSTSFSLEFLINIPTGSNNTQVIFQKISSIEDGFTLFLEESLIDTVQCVYTVCSGSFRNFVDCSLEKGKWNHICAIHNKDSERGDLLQLYVNEQLIKESDPVKLGKLNTDNSPLLIGSGSSFYKDKIIVEPSSTFNGLIDELRIFHSVRSLKDQILFSSRGLYSTPDLKLYYRFNEPSGSFSLNGPSSSIDSIVLDSSGNSLHANITGFLPDMRVNQTENSQNPLKNEKKEFTIVLFPAHFTVLSLNADLLDKAKDYDRNNPNNIIRLIPPHYLLEGAAQDGFASPEGNIGESYSGEGIPGNGKLGSVQIILTFLYIWSKYFDELKMYLDSFGTLKNISYTKEENTIPDNFLEDRIKEFGYYLPKIFTNSDFDSFLHGDSLDPQEEDTIPLREIQSEIMRRVLINLPKISRSKGTQHSIKSFLRSVGIDPNNTLKIREYGGPTTKQLGSSRENRTETFALLDFSTSSYVFTPFLSSSRTEPGFPETKGEFVFKDNICVGTDRPSDGLLTSGSWHIEAIFKIPPQKINLISDYYGNQSLLKIVGTGSISTENILYGNLIATQGVSHPFKLPTVKLFLRPGIDILSPTLELSLPLNGEGIFDGETWNISFGCERNDAIGSIVSSSYYLRAGKMEEGEITKLYSTSSYFYETPLNEVNVFRELSSTHNASGSFISLGPNQEIEQGASSYHLGDYLHVDYLSRTTDYVGWCGNLKFYSTSLSLDEWKEHVRNPLSAGVRNPFKNYNYVNSISGSFGKLRLDTLKKQPERYSDSFGNIEFLDFSLNLGNCFGTGFLPSTNILVGDVLNYSMISPQFDEVACDDKIRLRSFQDINLVEENPWSVIAPTYLSDNFFSSEEPQDDLRLSIEFSLMDALDKDIIGIFSSLDVLNNSLGAPENLFSENYPDLDVLRDVYFNKLSNKPDWRSFLEFYRWFDLSVSTFIEQLIPSKTSFKGTNFVVESHMLERHKNIYRWDGNYLGDRIVVNDDFRVQQIVGRINKY